MMVTVWYRDMMRYVTKDDIRDEWLQLSVISSTMSAWFCKLIEYQKRSIDERIGKTDAFDDCAGLVPDAFDLQFENDPDGLSGDIQRFFECRDALPIARVQSLNLLQRHFGEVAWFVGGAIDGLVMQQHEMSVAGFAQVDLHEICVKRSSFPNRGESIFGSVTGGSAMTDA